MTDTSAGLPGDTGTTTRGEPLVWVNGESLDAAVHVSAFDRGLTLADGIFETMFVREGRIFRLDRHLARLRRGLAVLEIPEPAGLIDWLDRACRAHAGERLSISDAGLRLTVTRGSGHAGVGLPAESTPTVIVSLNQLPSFPEATYAEGLSLHVVSGRRNERSVTAGLKTLAYTDAVVGLLEARRAGADDALFLDMEGHCSEATASNLFVWSGTSLVTPPLSCGVLPGVTREAVLELARSQGLPVAERTVELDDLMAAEEAFLTSSLRRLAPVVRVGGCVIGAGTPGRVTAGLVAAYAALVDRECRP
jgi:branched-chain amino acid aminotransferase